VLPLRLGEALRVTTVVRRGGLGLGPATASTLALRAADVLAVLALAAGLGSPLIARLAGPWWWLVVAGVVAAGAGGIAWLRRLDRGTVRFAPFTVFCGSVVAWVLESGIVWVAASAAGIDLAPIDAVLVTAVVIAAQTFAITPGGVGTYEAAASAALLAWGAEPPAAVAAAVAAHALKTGYALGAGTVAAFVPSPTMFGRLRLPKASSARVQPDAPDGSVVLFLPAHNEEQTAGTVVARAPSATLGRDVEVLVVDDGSTDRTAAVAAAAGASVLPLSTNRGLGAAVRAGIGEALHRGAAAVAFCDADGEYAPEELEAVVAPILRGEADYVVGSRFAGHIRRMPPHRRLGNVALTLLLRFVSRAPITDGQSGFRALSAAAAAEAEVIHDFNYAQVLTLDLLAKGYRYAEVPISYGFREHGRSFVKLGRYVRAVVPAVHRELNSA
jgi:hypothetical protein